MQPESRVLRPDIQTAYTPESFTFAKRAACAHLGLTPGHGKEDVQRAVELLSAVHMCERDGVRDDSVGHERHRSAMGGPGTCVPAAVEDVADDATLLLDVAAAHSLEARD